MMSSKHEYLCTHIIEKVENIKMSAAREMTSFYEEEQMVERVGGRGRRLMRALPGVRREQAGKVPQNLQGILDYWTRHQLQEVGPHGWKVERRPGGLQAWGRRNGVIDSAPRTEDTNDEGQQTVPKDIQGDLGLEYGQGQAKYPLQHPDFPMTIIPLLWGALWPLTDALIVKTFCMTYFPCHPTL